MWLSTIFLSAAVWLKSPRSNLLSARLLAVSILLNFSAMAASVPVAELKAIWESKELDSGSKLATSRALLVQHKKAEFREMHVNKVLVHPANRGGGMLGYHDVHVKGDHMLTAGCRLDKISDADAFELSRSAATRDLQISKNKKLVQGAAGCLAPVRGEETVLSVGCGHTAAFCRATNAGCKTPVKQLGLACGHLSLDTILADKANKTSHPFRSMCEKGWEWFVIDSDVELAYPELPSLWQSALNASHSVQGQPLEMETASFVAERLVHTSVEEAKMAAAAGSPNCLSYLDAIVHLVINHGGGPPDFAIIRYLDSFSKAYGKSIVLGEDFVRAVAYTTFSDDLSTIYSLTRSGLLVTQLTSEKIVDGVAKMLNRSDVDKLKHKDFLRRDFVNGFQKQN